MKAEWLMLWWNLIFIVPFGLALLYLGVYAMSGITFGDADVGVDADMDADAEIAAADAHVGADADAADHDFHHHDGHMPFHLAAMSWLGIGRVPLSLVLMVLMMTWGLFGFATSYYLEGNWDDRTFVPPIAIAVAAIGSLLMTALSSRAIVRWLPTSETYAVRRHELLGRTGEAIYQIDQQSGVVSLRDEHNDLFQVPCRVHADRDPISKGTRVRLIAYNGREKAYYVTEHDPAKVAG
jgi:membrane protein implicated in regulation of membrane protease activity